MKKISMLCLILLVAGSGFAKTVKDFEEYADSAALNGDSAIVNFMGSTSSLTLGEVDGENGSKALIHTYGPDGTHGYYQWGMLFGGADWSKFEKFRIWFKGKVDNPLGNIVLTLESTDGTVLSQVGINESTVYDEWTCIEAPIDPALPWNQVNRFFFTITAAQGETGQLAFDSIELITNQVVDDFESYTTNEEMQAIWQRPFYAGNGTFDLTLASGEGVDGSNALKYYYVGGSTPDMQHLFHFFRAGQDCGDYDTLKISYRVASPSSTPRMFQAYLVDMSDQLVAVATIPDLTGQQTNEWFDMTFDLNEKGVYPTLFKFIGYIYDVAEGESATIYFDNVRLTKSISKDVIDVLEKGYRAEPVVVSLFDQPAGDVVITATPDANVDLGNGTGVAVDLTFTPDNWRTRQYVSVASATDFAGRGNGLISFTSTSNSIDPSDSTVRIWPLRYTVEDFESYANWMDLETVWVNGGVGSGSSFVQDLDTTTSVSGSKSLSYEVTGSSPNVWGYTIKGLSACNSVNASFYDHLSVMVKGQASNPATGGDALLLVRNTLSDDPYKNVGTAGIADLSVDQWQEMRIDIDNDPYWVNINQILFRVSPFHADAKMWFDDLVFTKDIVDVDDNGGIYIEEGLDESGEFAIGLLIKPSGNVTIDLTGDNQVLMDAGNGYGNSAQIVFTPENFDQPQIVSVLPVDDAIFEMNHVGKVSFAATSSDANYNGCSIGDLIVNIKDDDLPAYLVVNDFEQYADTAALNADTQIVNYMRSCSDMTLSLDGGLDGSKCLVYDYDPNDIYSYFQFGMMNLQDVDWQAYDRFGVWYKGLSSNDAQLLCLVSQDVAGKEYYNIAYDATNATAWSYLEIPLKDIDDQAWQRFWFTIYMSGTDAPAGQMMFDSFALYMDPIIVSEPEADEAIKEGTDKVVYYDVKMRFEPGSPVTVDIQTDGQCVVDAGSGFGQSVNVVFDQSNWMQVRTISVKALDNDVLDYDRFATISHTVSSNDSLCNSNGSIEVSVKLQDNELGAWGFLKNDIDNDGYVGGSDVGEMGLEWLVDNELKTEQVDVLEDCENYTADLSGSWFSFTNPNGTNGQSSFSLIDSAVNAYAGSKAVSWGYDFTGVEAGMCEMIFKFDAPVDMSQFDLFKLWMKRHSDNSEEKLLYIKFMNGGEEIANISGESWITYEEGSTWGNPNGEPDEWYNWIIDLADLRFETGGGATNGYSSVDQMTNVTAVMFGIWSSADGWDDGGAGLHMGTGTIDFDDFELVKLPGACLDRPLSDLNGDCKVNINDIAELAKDWLKCTDPANEAECYRVF